MIQMVLSYYLFFKGKLFMYFGILFYLGYMLQWVNDGFRIFMQENFGGDILFGSEEQLKDFF